MNTSPHVSVGLGARPALDTPHVPQARDAELYGELSAGMLKARGKPITALGLVSKGSGSGVRFGSASPNRRAVSRGA